MKKLYLLPPAMEILDVSMIDILTSSIDVSSEDYVIFDPNKL